MRVGEAQIRCDYQPCGKVAWRHGACRLGSNHFCTPECRNAHQRLVEAQFADERLRMLNLAYGDGFLHGLLGVSIGEASGAPREQVLRGVMDGRGLRRIGGP